VQQGFGVVDDGGIARIERDAQALRPGELADVAVAQIQAEQFRVVGIGERERPEPVTAARARDQASEVPWAAPVAHG
jgi:hypothetical protein